ncbi:MAG: hypothetical protein FWD18_09255 [Micrococcales bacterium]|nr:hypothetical protein [Micrococcales bacterium]
MNDAATRTTVMQKVPPPAMAEAYLSLGLDRVSGFVLRAADAAVARTPADVFEMFGLGFPGSPHSPEAPHVDVVRFPLTPQLQIIDATGGRDEATRQLTGGPFVERAPFTGTGLVSLRGNIAPLYWMVHARVPAGSQLWRLHADGSQTHLATFPDLATGWVLASGESAGRPAMPGLSRFVGPVAAWQDAHYNADPTDDGTVVLTSPTEPEGAGFEQTAIGRWRRVVHRAEVTALFEMNVTGTWNGLPVRILDTWDEADGEQLAQITYTGHNADLAEGLRLTKMDAAVYEAAVPSATITDVRTVQLVPTSWT